MALTASITTADGVVHDSAYALVYPLTLQTLTGDSQVKMTLHCWHSQSSKENQYSELSGYPTEISFHGEAALEAIVNGLSAMADIEWTENPEQNALLAEAAIIEAIEDAIIGQRPEFTRIL